MFHLSALTAGVILDWIFGDPLWLPHPVVGIGRLIGVLEKRLCRPGEPGQIWRGRLLVLLVILISVGLPWAVLSVVSWLDGGRGIFTWCLTAFWSFQLLAARGLYTESGKVRRALENGETEKARTCVSMIVGRDTASLDEAGMVRAAVETVGENASDGVTAPLVYMAAFGILGGFFYKAVNTMDSMIGYKNDRYLEFGRAAAKLDDFCNWIPARLTGGLLTAGAWILGVLPGGRRARGQCDGRNYDGRNAWQIFLRDRKKHTSPNSAHGEAACAGALHIRLGGDSYYFGKLVHKPWIGDKDRAEEPEDIRRAGKLMIAGEILCLAIMWVLAVLQRCL